MNDQQIEQEIQAKGLAAPRITPACIDPHLPPVKLAHDAYVIATVGGAAATGLLESVVSFEHRGTM